MVASVALACPAASQTPRPGPREVYLALNGLHADSTRTYYVRDLVIRRDVVRIALTEGKLVFFQPYEGHIHGAVFTGQGRAIAVPPDPIERRSLAYFLGTPLLDVAFQRAYLRFTDNTAEELLAQLEERGVRPVTDTAMAEAWDSAVATLNPWHSLRTLSDRLSEQQLPYFYARCESGELGPFDVIVDGRREEQITIGQPKMGGGALFYDFWASFPRDDAEAPGPAFTPVRYAVNTTIHTDLELEATTLADIRVVHPGERVVPLELSRNLKVESVLDGQGRPLVFFQNEGLNADETARRGNDALLVVLAEPAVAGSTLRLRIAYKGTVISDAGNGAFFVGDRGTWYPNLGRFDSFAEFDLTFRWPALVELVANGKKIEERTEGETRIARWVSETPIPLAGFNLGLYEQKRVEGNHFVVEVYANRHLDTATLERLRQASPSVVLSPGPMTQRRQQLILSTVLLDPPPPSPAEHLEELGKEVAEAIRFHEKLSGDFPFSRLAVSQIPSSFGQGWPGLLYLSTLAFLSPGGQARVGADRMEQKHFSDLVAPHEVAHQWWGNTVGWPSYRDQWIHEGLASYLALLYADSRKPGGRTLREWLAFYRDSLLEKHKDFGRTADVGPLVLGQRLQSSKSNRAYTPIVYGKGAWVFHMLRMLLRDPQAADPDARFTQWLKTLAATYRHRGLSTTDLQREIERIMTPEMDLEEDHTMDWFFDQWVRGTEIPKYSVTFKATPRGNRYLIRGTLKQEGVGEIFTAPVPLYAETARGQRTLLGTVVTAGVETSFRFTTRALPKRILIDPEMTLLAVPQ